MTARVVRLRNGYYAIQQKDWITFWLGWWTAGHTWEIEAHCIRYCDELNLKRSAERPTDPVEVVCPERKPL